MSRETIDGAYIREASNAFMQKMLGGRLEQCGDITSDFEKANTPYHTTVAQIH